ncbi:hypothetical protein HBA54_18420 [Pelagibius litoralis]|uniref:Uncharacterized protein n=1 Tax=Pelagibius litoralis TaxID=374515 RepID=A0A967KE55_9PROT|nr:hypothetical protein [Pelagibius litoralis]NIA70575.1 hypothetical protein [Pelagibius litoralis]
MVRVSSGRQQRPKDALPDVELSAGLLFAEGEDAPRVGRLIAQQSAALLRRSGVSPDSLQHLGTIVSDHTGNWRAAVAEDPALPLYPPGECRLWCDDDGTFELNVKVFDRRQKTTPALAYDTWSVFVPLKGMVCLHWVDGRDVTHRRLAPGQSLGFPVGQAVAIEVVGDWQAVLLRLFGIATTLLPPPRPVPLPADDDRL